MKINTFRRVFERRSPGCESWGQLKISLTPLAMLIFVLALLTVSQPAPAQKIGETSTEQSNVITIPPDPTNSSPPVVVTVVPKSSDKQPQTLPAQVQQMGQSPPERKPPPAVVNCPPRDANYHYLYKGVKRVALVMELPWGWQEAWDCHGHEDGCADKVTDRKLTPADRAAYVDAIKRAYQPHEELTPNALQRRYIMGIKQRLLHKLPTDEACTAPEIVVDKPRMAYDPGTLVIHVQIDLEPGSLSGEVISLRTSVYRPDIAPSALIHLLLRPYLGDIVPISLKWADENVSAAVSSHEDLFFTNLPSNE